MAAALRRGGEAGAAREQVNAAPRGVGRPLPEGEVAEGGGFEPPERLTVRSISSRVL